MPSISEPTPEFKFHPRADIFPLMEGEEFDALVADIKANGLREKIVLFEGKILDGRNRYRACLRAHVEPQTVEFEGNEAGALAFVISKNIHRRHLAPEKKRELMVKCADWTKSDRAIGEQFKCDHKTASKARKQAEATGEASPVEKRADLSAGLAHASAQANGRKPAGHGEAHSSTGERDARRASGGRGRQGNEQGQGGGGGAGATAGGAQK